MQKEPKTSEIDLDKYQELIREECDTIKELLLTKNEEYDGSVFKPLNIFNKEDAEAAVKVRIDDKLKRIRNDREKKIKEDTVLDLIGYLILMRVIVKSKSEEDTKDPDDKEGEHEAGKIGFL